MADETRIWIGGLPDNITEDEIQDEYKRYGSIENVHVHAKKGCPSFAFVKYSDRRDAEDAVKETDQAKLFGMPFVKVSWAGKSVPKGKGKSKGRGGRSRSRSRRSRSRGRGSRSPPRRNGSKARGKGGRSPSRRKASRPRSPPPPPPTRRGDSRNARRSPPRSRAPEAAEPRKRRPPSPPPGPYVSERERERAPPRRDSRARTNQRSPVREDTEPRKRRLPSPPPKPDTSGRDRPLPPSEKKGTYRIKLEHLPDDLGWQELKELGSGFAKVGQCTFARTNRDQTGILEYTDYEDMRRAIDSLDGRRFSGSQTRIQAQEEKARR